MKKILLATMTALACMFMYSCGDSGDDGPDPGPGPGPEPEPQVEEESLQFVNKTIALPAENFPAIDVSANEITLIKGDYAAFKNGTQFNGDQFAEGVTIVDGDVIKIQQDGKELVQFTTKTGGSGTKLKILGMGSNAALTGEEGVGRGIYTFTIRTVDADAAGYLKGTNLYADGDPAKPVQSMQFEGGKKYLVRRDHQPESGNKIDAEGWIYYPWVADMGNGYPCDNTLTAMSIYPEEAFDLPVEQQVPIISSRPLPEAGYYTFRITHLFNPNTIDPSLYDGSKDNLGYYVQGNGLFSAYMTMNERSINYSDWDAEYLGVDPDHQNQNFWERAFGVNAEFYLYVCESRENLTEATPEQYRALVSTDGLDPGDNYVIVKFTEPAEMVNTQEDLMFVFKRKANADDPGALIRFEGVGFDEALGHIVTEKGMNFRTTVDGVFP